MNLTLKILSTQNTPPVKTRITSLAKVGYTNAIDWVSNTLVPFVLCS